MLRDLFATQGACQAAGFLEDEQRVAPDLGSLTAPPAAMIGKKFGPYRVISLLGHGGMGSVWLAERVDGLFTRRVALKLVHPALMDRVMTERLGREREILASLDHPKIARLFDAGFAEDGQPYLALEYIAGTPLTTYCDERRLSIAVRLELLRQVLSAVQYAHANLVIHRDLKPSNILVTEDGRAHLLDFGIAKLLTTGVAKETELTQLGGRALTPDYAAPEQIAGAPVTTAADVYALGVMLYELLTGQRPYRPKRDSRGALEEAIMQDDPVAPSRVTPSEATATARDTTARKLVSAMSPPARLTIPSGRRRASCSLRSLPKSRCRPAPAATVRKAIRGVATPDRFTNTVGPSSRASRSRLRRSISSRRARSGIAPRASILPGLSHGLLIRPRTCRERYRFTSRHGVMV
jgi:serine/threonine protein kinase